MEEKLEKEGRGEGSISSDIRPIVGGGGGGAWMTHKEEEKVGMMMYYLYMYLHNTHSIVTYRGG